MMNEDCRRTAGRLAPYVDDLLPASEQAEVRRHLDRCRLCQSAADRERGARAILRSQARALTDTTPPPGLRSRCEALLRDHASASARRRRFALRPFASVTAIMAGAVALFLFSLATHRSDTVLAAQLTADHAKCFRLFATGESADEDARRVERMLQQDYGWNVRVPPSSPAAGVHLLGARRCLYADGWLPHVMYRVGGHDVSLYMLNGVTRHAGDLVSLGHRSHIWNRGDRTYVLVWPVSGGDMGGLLQYVMAEAR
jgi:anti-sigma factor RsiW